MIKMLLFGLVALEIIFAFFSNRSLRLIGTLAGAAGLAIFFILLLTKIYPPVLPTVMISAIPFLCGLLGSVWFAFLPKKNTVRRAAVQADGDGVTPWQPVPGSRVKRKGKRLIVPIFMVIILFGGAVLGGLISGLIPISEQRTLLRLQSPDKHSLAVLSYRENRSFALPFQPDSILARQCRLKVSSGDKNIYDSGYEGLNIYQTSPGFALDLMWSPDSAHLAYRYIKSLRIIGPDGKSMSPDIALNGSEVTSFKWIDNENLLVVSKRDTPRWDDDTAPCLYDSYIECAGNITITQFNIKAGKTERYQQAMQAPTMLFHSIDYPVEEISPKADRVAFSDGENLCVFDNATGKLIAKTKIPQGKPKDESAQLEGVWWQTNDRLVIRVVLFESDRETFYTYDIPSAAMVDVTDTLSPVWNEPSACAHDDPDWYRAAVKQVAPPVRITP